MEPDWKQRLLEHLRRPQSRSQSKSEICRSLEVAPTDRAALRQALQELEAAGEVVCGRGGRYQLRRAAKGVLRGVVFLRLGKSGGLFVPDFSDPESALQAAALGLAEDSRLAVSQENLNTAMHGDRVLTKVTEQRSPSVRSPLRSHRNRWITPLPSGGPAVNVRVIEILERRHQNVSGTFHRRDKRTWLVPDDPLLPRIIEVPMDREAQVQPGDKIVVTVDDWAVRSRAPRGRLLRRLGRSGEKGVDILGLIYKFRLPLEFPAAVLQAADQTPQVISGSEIQTREDWRGREVITIDPVDARDFDDAIAVTRLPNGHWELAVHIADVSHYVRPDSELDREARRRGNSIYLADRVIPMLPEALSNGICSLRPDEDRLTRAAILTFDESGRRIGARFAAAVIRSQRRYTYEEAFASMKPWLEHPDRAWETPFGPLPARAWALAARLRKRRMANGSLDLDFPEIRVALDENGEPVGLTRVEHDESHQLIEEFMLAANEAVAEQMRRAAKPAIFRVHEPPDPDKLEELRAFLGTHQISTGDLSLRREMQKALRIINQRPDAPVLKLAVLKSMKRAAYHADPLGHFGLAMENYTHFTSPIRRYADLVVHRVQANLLWQAKHPTPGYGAMKELAAHLSITERTAAEAETESRKLKELAYFERLIREQSPVTFKAAVMDVRRSGLFVELAEVLTRGIVRAEDLGVGWQFDPGMQRFIRWRPRQEIRVGQVVEVAPGQMERERGSVAFLLKGIVAAGVEGRKGRTRRPGQSGI
ncbi:MAG: VacB/RNase II family 3'-5' exoribonuclease [Verrucomicrobiales bacterium]|nr:VacB/RNase II family 3'-5' exoribonuclease [Verrucomicrobiales bacterium]